MKSPYGLVAAPRLWYLRAKGLMAQCGWVELAVCRATFQVIDPTLLLPVGVCCLHVDDGLVFGDETNEIFRKAREEIDQHFTMKAWKSLSDGRVDYLGSQIRQLPDFTVEENMRGDCDKITMMPVDKGTPNDEILLPHQVKELRSLVMRVYWPARRLLPHIMYEVNRIAGELNSATYGHIRRINATVKRLRELHEGGEDQLLFRAVDLRSPFIVTPFDVSYANDPGSRSQATFLNIATDKSILSGRASAGLLEHSSRRISKVVRSTMAAESASLAAAVDHHLYCKLLWQHLLYRGAPVCGEWRKILVVGGCVVTDAKSVFDNLSKTG